MNFASSCKVFHSCQLVGQFGKLAASVSPCAKYTIRISVTYVKTKPCLLIISDLMYLYLRPVSKLNSVNGMRDLRGCGFFFFFPVQVDVHPGQFGNVTQQQQAVGTVWSRAMQRESCVNGGPKLFVTFFMQASESPWWAI